MKRIIMIPIYKLLEHFSLLIYRARAKTAESKVTNLEAIIYEENRKDLEDGTNYPLEWDEIWKLPDDTKVWSEYYGVGHGGGSYIKRGKYLYEDCGIASPMHKERSETYRKGLNHWYRIWRYPKRPTAEEIQLFPVPFAMKRFNTK